MQIHACTLLLHVCNNYFIFNIISVLEKLNVDVGLVRHGVEGLMYLLVESAKLKVNEIDFLDSIMILGYDEELNKELLAVRITLIKEKFYLLTSYIKSIVLRYVQY